MASHQLAIAKASLAAGLLRPDPASVPRDEIAQLHSLLDDAIIRCSSANIQRCKAWLLKNVTASSARISAVGKYLVALSGSLASSEGAASAASQHSSSTAQLGHRKCLHILYLLNDVLHHTKYHSASSSVHTSVTSNLQPHLVKLVEHAAPFEASKHKKLQERVLALLDLWKECGYYSDNFISKLRETVENAGFATAKDPQPELSGDSAMAFGQSASGGRNAPYVMPATHGDPSTPWYDLPAGNMLPHIVPNSTVPINTQMMKPLQFVAGPADQALAHAVKDFLTDAEGIYNGPNHDEGIVADIDELGQHWMRDEITGELASVENYYGWSMAFCEKMKRRHKDGPLGGTERGGRSRSRSASRSRSLSSSPHKRRRRDSSASFSRSRSREQTRGRHNRPHASSSRSPSRSPSQHRARHVGPSHGSRSRSSSRTRFNPPPRHHRDTSNVLPGQLELRNGNGNPSPQDPRGGFIPPPPFLDPRGFPVGPGGMPGLPPPPPNYHGPWPPPPPPLPTGGLHGNQQPSFPPYPGFVQPPPQGMGMPYPPVPGNPSPPNVYGGGSGYPHRGNFGGHSYGNNNSGWQHHRGNGQHGWRGGG